MGIKITTTTVHANMTCDHSGCSRTISCVTAAGIPPEHAAGELEDYAISNGWTVWTIRRQGPSEFFSDFRHTAYKHRCPEHPPAPLSELIHLTKNVSASCYYGHHGTPCDWSMKHTTTMDGVDYRRQCRCDCHKEQS